jgi:hypothetical protein
MPGIGTSGLMSGLCWETGRRFHVSARAQPRLYQRKEAACRQEVGAVIRLREWGGPQQRENSHALQGVAAIHALFSDCSEG